MIEILLATYNGERFLPEQIESITSQSFEDYNILASDDNSSDCTFEILRSYESVFGEKIKVVQSKTFTICLIWLMPNILRFAIRMTFGKATSSKKV